MDLKYRNVTVNWISAWLGFSAYGSTENAVTYRAIVVVTPLDELVPDELIATQLVSDRDHVGGPVVPWK